MYFLKSSAFFLAALFIGLSSYAQMTPDPTTWQYEVKKKNKDVYQLIFHLELKSGWHIWSLHPGGDGYQIIPAFNPDKNPNVTVTAKPVEKGKSTTVTMEGIDGKVTFLGGKVDYIMEVKVKGTTKISGKHTYQVCDDKMCLAPVDKDFIFEIK